LIVGDTEIDIRTGKALGLKTVALLSGIRSHERLAEEHPDCIVEDINALPQLVKRGR
jgi:phosphoglycolate phosphatase